MAKEEFYTFREYMNNERNNLSACEEDYIEMIYRICIQNKGYTRVNDLALALNVKPPSVSKMVKKLGTKELIRYKKYGTIELSEGGEQIGKMLLDRHNIIEGFLNILNISNNLLEETEKIEHTISPQTVKAIKRLVDFFEINPDILNKFSLFMKEDDNEN
ncbi:iron dependent repressor, metal binding and dimerization domain protein [Clostridium sp. MB40-C1]|uniref:metal-dependent transcriptional regulator n=1 Tax=Clostridium sp. MB40-C1 TaxID=3070996 RepID=UPI0027E002E0|nr:iron dependent repressor, metal binding and dimerization domain protein [Clostridium sp. MB40-C1]WMJ80414.1 iron dependent repressor, metal binding and dimerization domain protein [Clostridium sp. MB40-C1]